MFFLFVRPCQKTAQVRLNKFLADAGIASRRGADALIQGGRVCVNGLIQREPGTRVIPGQDTVLCNGAPVSSSQDIPSPTSCCTSLCMP
jgi:23S rRNA pseudouridine2605 synthase